MDVGEFPDASGAGGVAADDPQRPVKIVAHMVARVMDKFGPLRKLSRQAEGRDSRSGLISDAFAAGVELYKRNPEQFQDMAKGYYRAVSAKRRERKTQKGVTTA